MKKLLLVTLFCTALPLFASEEPKMRLGKKITVAARAIRYLLSPTFNSPERQKEITNKQAYLNWEVEIKHFSDVIYQTDFDDDTQFAHAIDFISEKIKNDQQPLAGHFVTKREFRKMLNAEHEATLKIYEDVNLLKTYGKYRADYQPLKRSFAPVWSKNLNFQPTQEVCLDQYQSLQDLIAGGQATSESCEKVCPKNHLMLRLHRSPLDIDYRKPETSESFTSFRNLPEDFENYIKKQFGFCWRHTSVLYKFKRYALFAPSEAQDSLEVVKQKIQDIVRSEKIVEFKGYKSLLELTQNEELKTYLMAEVAREWARNALSIPNLLGLKKATHVMSYR